MTPTRNDLLALDPDTLAAMANRGLVKRAAKELDAGGGPELDCDPDGTVRGSFPDGARTVLPPGAGLTSAACDCGAPGVCRHRIGLVLAYQRAAARAAAHPVADRSADAPSEPPPVLDWSPGGFTDEALTLAVGTRAVANARRTHDRGYTARLHRPSAGQPAAWVELPSCTVRFPVPGELGHVITDAATELRGEVTALAVWAFRAADGTGAVQVDVGGRAATAPPTGALDAATALVDELLLEGAAHAGPVLVGTLRRVRDDLAAAALHWPAGALGDAADQLEAYAARSARYRATAYADALGELHARHRAAARPGGAAASQVLASQVLGSRESGTTALRRVRLTALGCRVGGSAREPVAEVFLAHGGIVLVLRRSWASAAAEPPQAGQLASRRLLGTTLGALAVSNLVSESVTRSASRALVVGRSRVAATSVTPLGAAWSELPPPVLVRDLAAYARGLDGLPPRLLRPRVEAENLHVVEVAETGPIGYDPAQQRLEARITDPAGHPATVSATYNPLCPGSLDALAEALGTGGVRYLSGSLTRSGGGIMIAPVAVGTADGGVVVPDLAPSGAGTELPTGDRGPLGDPVSAALDSALHALADAAHQGLRRLRPTTLTALDDAANALARIGLTDSAALLRELATATRSDATSLLARTWVEAQIRLTVTTELHHESGAGSNG
ncbi:hypothetical protein ACEZCY_26170 [Streptacidiphilus sp. N1-12]|uniref:SWIM-type domain-containing protein n=2 Tax=Streptacidiphilus alkalitolerans TaxID=3342712 RepID=A0ABV6V7Z5_9ACTN